MSKKVKKNWNLKNLNLLEAIALARVKRRIRYQGGIWWRYSPSMASASLVDDKGFRHWPHIETQIEKTWEVEPVEITVHGVCDESGKSYLYTYMPEKEGSVWVATRGPGGYVQLEEDNLFSKTEPEEYVLTKKEK